MKREKRNRSEKERIRLYNIYAVLIIGLIQFFIMPITWWLENNKACYIDLFSHCSRQIFYNIFNKRKIQTSSNKIELKQPLSNAHRESPPIRTPFPRIHNKIPVIFTGVSRHDKSGIAWQITWNVNYIAGEHGHCRETSHSTIVLLIIQAISNLYIPNIKSNKINDVNSNFTTS